MDTTVVQPAQAAGAKSNCLDLPAVGSEASKLSVAFTIVSDTLPRRTAEVGPFADHADYVKRGLVDEAVTFRVWEIDGSTTKLYVPESYDKALAAGELPERARPADVVSIVAGQADPSYFRRIYVLDTPNWEDDWVRQDYSATFVSVMAVNPEGDLFLFRKESNAFLRGDIGHEWAHRLAAEQPEFYSIFGDAIELGWRSYRPREYALRSYGEHWAVIGEELLKPEGEKFTACAAAAPVRTLLFMLAVESSLTKSGTSGAASDVLKARIAYVRETVLPLARESLKATVAGDNADHAERAKKIEEFLNKRLA